MSDDRATAEESVDEPDDPEEAFESERTATRAEAAAVLRGLADGVDAGAVALGEGEDALAVAVPDSFEFEVEYEREDDEVEIEVELEWAPDDEPATSEAVAGGDAGDTDESESDPEDGTDDDLPAVETATVAAAEVETGDGDEVDTGDEDEADTGDEDEVDEPTPGREAVESPVAAAAPVVSQARFELFRDRADEWRWRLVHRNGNVIASSGEGYTRKHNAEKGMRSVMRNAPDADVVED
ncbi:HVO_2922 family protein [Halosimplex halobium]|uniref:HVO_2922 family protein n=1 Tax=Halosimplex halobium TaxID=3396618 RepID=UPI003F54894F